MLNRTEHGRSSNRRSRIVLWLCGLTLVLMMLDRQGLLAPVTEQTAQALVPATRTLTSIRLSIGEALSKLFGSSGAASETATLQAQITQLQNENLALRSAAAENITLRRTAGMRERYGWQTTIANVVGRSPDNATRMLTIDRGRVDGLAIGMPVISHVAGSPDALIGLIDTLTDHTASVLLITDARSIISGQILHRNAQTGELSQPNGEILGQWQLGSRLIMRQIERDAPVEIGDDVLTAGISRAIAFDGPAARIPPDVPIGKVVAKRPSGHSQEIDVQPYFDSDQVRTVWIIVGVD